MRCRVGKENADLAVDDASGCAGILSPHAGRRYAFFEESGFIADKDAVLLAEMLNNDALEIITQLVRFPAVTIRAISRNF